MVPADYMGAQISLYRDDNALCVSTSMSYNRYPDTGWDNYAYNSGCFGHGVYYYARGPTAAYDGSPYKYFYTAATPAMYYP